MTPDKALVLYPAWCTGKRRGVRPDCIPGEESQPGKRQFLLHPSTRVWQPSSKKPIWSRAQRRFGENSCPLLEKDESGDDEVEGLTEGAKNNRLRRICERKPSGKCAVPDTIHEQWKAGGHKCQALMDILAESKWDKDPFDNQMQIPPYLLKYTATRAFDNSVHSLRGWPWLPQGVSPLPRSNCLTT